METETVKNKPSAGRPFTYDPQILVKAREYLEGCKDEQYRLVKSDGDKSTSYENRIKVKLPSIEGLSRFLKVHRSTIYEWEKSYPDFADIVEELRQTQAESLINNGLSGDYNPLIVKMILSSKHDYVEKIETKHSGEINNPYANLTDEQKIELARRDLEAIEKHSGKERSDISDGGNSELPKDGETPQASGGVPQESGDDQAQGDSPDTQKPSENDNGNDSVHDPENPQ